MTRPRLLDLFCGAGGAAMGYHQVGFDVVGVDINPQPRYPFAFIEADAFDYLDHVLNGASGWTYDAIHASPPCQQFTAYRRRGGGVGDRHPDLIVATRYHLMESGLPWVIENVAGAPLYPWWVQICGTGLALDVQRHRWFEASFPMFGVPCAHGRNPARFPQATNRTNKRRTVEVGVYRIPLADQQQAMGIDWMTLPELSQAIPPAYTRFIGEQLLAHLGIAA